MQSWGSCCVSDKAYLNYIPSWCNHDPIMVTDGDGWFFHIFFFQLLSSIGFNPPWRGSLRKLCGKKTVFLRQHLTYCHIACHSCQILALLCAASGAHRKLGPNWAIPPYFHPRHQTSPYVSIHSNDSLVCQPTFRFCIGKKPIHNIELFCTYFKHL